MKVDVINTYKEIKKYIEWVKMYSDRDKLKSLDVEKFKFVVEIIYI